MPSPAIAPRSHSPIQEEIPPLQTGGLTSGTPTQPTHDVSADQRFSPLVKRKRKRSNDDAIQVAGHSSSHSAIKRQRAPAPMRKSGDNAAATAVRLLGATPAGGDLIAGNPDVVALENMPAEHAAHGSYREMQVMVRNLDELSESLSKTLVGMTQAHCKLKTALEKLDKTTPVSLSEAQFDRLATIQHHMAMAQQQKEEVNELRSDLAKCVAEGKANSAKGRTWSEWAKSENVQKSIAATEIVFSMLAKFAAWNGIEAILPIKAAKPLLKFGNFAAMAGKRFGLSLGFAAVTEYIPGTDGMRRWVDAGGDVKTAQGLQQAADQAITLAGQFGVASATGQSAPSAGQAAAFGLVGLGGVLQTGALNRPIMGAINYMRGGDPADKPIEFIDIEARKAAQAERTTGPLPLAEAAGRDLEQGGGAVVQGPPEHVSVNALLEDLEKNHLDNLKGEITRSFASLSGLHKALHPNAAAVDGVAMAEACDAHLASCIAALPEADRAAGAWQVPNLTDAQQGERFQQHIQAIREKAIEFRDSLPDNHVLRQKIDDVFKDAKQVEEAIARAGENATPHEKAFFWSMGALGVAGSLMTAIGSFTDNKFLSDLNNRGAIAGVTSSFGQCLAQFGQFMGGARPNDNLMKKFLKIGQQEKNPNEVIEFAKGWARNTRFLPIEYMPLTISTMMAEMGNQLKGQAPQAPSKAIPDFTTDRIVMETARMSLANAMAVFKFGHKLEWNHYAGLASTAAGAATSIASGMRK